ncbi:MAG: DUF2723 domain-containing protein [Candidatus Eisenbacteria bacterium]|nr:DUF2723 domain-containing protein [Candidatus Eisenbacteria bacterium]
MGEVNETAFDRMGGRTGSARSLGGDGWTALVVLVIVAAVYGITMAPNVSFWDSGEFIAAGYILGIPHPPGTPLYVLVGRIFALLPFGIPAVRINLLSAVTGAAAAYFLFLSLAVVGRRIVPADGDRTDRRTYRLGAAVGALFAAFGSTCWTNATEAEVYAPSLLVICLSLWLLLRWHERCGEERDRKPLLLIGYVLSLSIGVHLGTYLALPAFLLFVLAVDRRAILDGRFLALLLFLTLLGVTVHFYLPIRSAMNPSIDEANPETRQALLDFLLRKQYKPNNPFVRQASWSFQFDMFWGYFRDQYGRFLPLLGVLGLAVHLRRDRRTFPLFATLFLITSLFLIFYMNFTDHEVRERDYFFAPSFFFWGGWMGLGAAFLFERLRRVLRRTSLPGGIVTRPAAALLLLLPFGVCVMHFQSHDRRGNLIANDYAWNILSSLDPNAVIFTNGDNDTFPLWYLQEVEGVRRDVRVVNLALLNTDWYIWQLKNLEPRVPFSWTDEEVKRLRPYRTKEGEVVLVKDLAIMDIARANRWKRPLYFAVTVADLMGLDEQKRLSLEGLVYRLVPEELTQLLDTERCERNLWKIYRYRGILDETGALDRKVARNRNQVKLITNYSTAFGRLAIQYRNEGRYEESIRNMEMAGRITPGYRVYEALMGPLLVEAERYEEAETLFLRQLAQAPESIGPHLGLAFIREKEGAKDEAESHYREAIHYRPTNRESYVRLTRLLVERGDWEGARETLREWLAIHPDDTVIQGQLGEVERVLERAKREKEGR